MLYEINYENNQIIISQNINQDLVTILINEFKDFKFKFTLHRNNILIGYKFN